MDDIHTGRIRNCEPLGVLKPDPFGEAYSHRAPGGVIGCFASYWGVSRSHLYGRGGEATSVLDDSVAFFAGNATEKKVKRILPVTLRVVADIVGVVERLILGA